MVQGVPVETAFRSDEKFTQAGFRAWLVGPSASAVERYELVGGRIVMTPPASWPHGALEARLCAMLSAAVLDGELGFVCGSSTGYELPSGDTLAPDVSFVSRERLERGPGPIPGHMLRVVPDLVIEILSRSTARRDRFEKCPIYAENGVDEYWMVDPERREVAVLRREGRTWATSETLRAGRVPSRVLPALKVTVEEIFVGLG